MGRRLHTPLRTLQKMATARSHPPSDQTTAAAAADGRDPSSQRPLPQQAHAPAERERPEQPDRRARLRRPPPRLSGRPAAPSAGRAARRDARRPACQGAVVRGAHARRLVEARAALRPLHRRRVRLRLCHRPRRPPPGQCARQLGHGRGGAHRLQCVL